VWSLWLPTFLPLLSFQHVASLPWGGRKCEFGRKTETQPPLCSAREEHRTVAVRKPLWHGGNGLRFSSLLCHCYAPGSWCDRRPFWDIAMARDIIISDKKAAMSELSFAQTSQFSVLMAPNLAVPKAQVPTGILFQVSPPLPNHHCSQALWLRCAGLHLPELHHHRPGETADWTQKHGEHHFLPPAFRRFVSVLGTSMTSGRPSVLNTSSHSSIQMPKH